MSETAAVFQVGGTKIGRDGDMACLTDMWRQAGGDPSKRPAQWLKSDVAKAFVDQVESWEKPQSDQNHFAAVRTTRGGKSPQTWAHWQVALAYAKFLSPAFHVAMNAEWRSMKEAAQRRDDEAFKGERQARKLAEYAATQAAGELAGQRELVEAAMAKVDALEARVNSLDPLSTGCIGEGAKWLIHGPLVAMARKKAQIRVGPLEEATNLIVISERTKLDNELRAYLSFHRGPSSGYEALPWTLKGRASGWIEMKLTRVNEEYANFLRQTQPPPGTEQGEMFDEIATEATTVRTKPKLALVRLREEAAATAKGAHRRKAP